MMELSMLHLLPKLSHAMKATHLFTRSHHTPLQTSQTLPMRKGFMRLLRQESSVPACWVDAIL